MGFIYYFRKIGWIIDCIILHEEEDSLTLSQITFGWKMPF